MNPKKIIRFKKFLHSIQLYLLSIITDIQYELINRKKRNSLNLKSNLKKFGKVKFKFRNTTN